MFRQTWKVSAQDIDNDDFSSLRSPRLQYASWLPTSAKSSHSGSAIVFVENYSIYYIPDVGKNKEKDIFPISSSEAVTDAIIHGIPDWIYEGKILPQKHTMNSLKIYLLRFVLIMIAIIPLKSSM